MKEVEKPHTEVSPAQLYIGIYLHCIKSIFSLCMLRTRKLHKKRRVIEDLVTTLRVEPASVPILSFKLKGLRSRLGSQEVRIRKKELIEVLLMKEQS